MPISIRKYVAITSPGAGGTVGDLNGGGVPPLPSGWAYLVKQDGTFWTNAQGAFYIKAVA